MEYLIGNVIRGPIFGQLAWEVHEKPGYPLPCLGCRVPLRSWRSVGKLGIFDRFSPSLPNYPLVISQVPKERYHS